MRLNDIALDQHVPPVGIGVEHRVGLRLFAPVLDIGAGITLALSRVFEDVVDDGHVVARVADNVEKAGRLGESDIAVIFYLDAVD